MSTPRTPEQICDRVNDLKSQHAERDGRHRDVYLIRDNQMASVYPEIFGTVDDTPLVANMINVVSHDLSEMVAPLPTLNTSPGNISSDRGRQRADKRKKIGLSYWNHWRLQSNMYGGVDRYFNYGYVPFLVEPDWDAKRPGGRFLDPRNGYPEFNKWGATISFTAKQRVNTEALCSMYPDMRGIIDGKDFMGNPNHKDVHVLTYYDEHQCMVYIEEFSTSAHVTMLERYENRLGKCPVVCAVMPSGDDQIRGQFDGALGALVAKTYMARLSMDAAEQMVEAPVILPTDVMDLNIGPNSIIRTDNPQGAMRMRLDVGNGALLQQAHLDQELRSGLRYPDSRSGGNVGSIVTGKGVEALNGTFDTQVKTAQQIFTTFLREITSLAFELDEIYWPKVSKDIRGVSEGVPFSESYTPGRDLKGEYTCDVTYGLMGGMDPNRGLIWILQALGAKLIDRETAQRNLPFDLDITELNRNIDVEAMREAGLAGLQAMVQAIGPMAQQGQDPSQLLTAVGVAIKARTEGKMLEEALLKAFPPPPPPDPSQQMAGPGGAPGAGGELPPGMQPSGLMNGVAPGQAGQAPGGQPALTQLLAGLTAGGKPNLGATVRRAVPVAGG